MTTPETPFRQCGSTDLASFTRALQRTASGSGVSTMSKDANLIFSTLQAAGLDRLGSAMAWHETKNGTYPGAIPFNYHNPWAVATGGGGGWHTWANYPTYHDAAADWATRLLDPHGPYAGAKTLREFINIYAPPSDGNDVATYLNVICREIDSLPLATPAPQPGPTPTPTPTPTPPPKPAPVPSGLIQVNTANHQPRNLGPSMVRFLVHHITDDMNVSNVLSWFKNPFSKASSTFVIDRNGTAYQLMSTLVAPWTNGEVNRPRTDIPALMQAIRQTYNLNEFCVTIEYVGTPAQPPTEAQYLKGIEIGKYVVGTYHVPPHRYGQLRHADIDSVNRPYCPGPHFDLARIIIALGGDPTRLAA